MARVYVHVMKYDFGFAPNPFHGACTLACCKPIVRRTANLGDWIVGVGGRDLKATGRCIYAMQVTGAMLFDEYWASPDFRAKRPRRNGSRRSMVGDNIYRRCPDDGHWIQENSIHSRINGEQDEQNTAHDTSVDRVLISEKFVYFGSAAPPVPAEILSSLNYRNGRGHRAYEIEECAALLKWIQAKTGGAMNRVLGDPFQLRLSNKRYSRSANRVI